MAVSKSLNASLARGSHIRRAFEDGLRLKQLVGEDVVCDLSLGNPIAEPPDSFFTTLGELIGSRRPGLHRYMPNAGHAEVRNAIAEHLGRVTGQPMTGDRIVLSVGAAGALNVLLRTLLDPGDEVLLLTPYFPEYGFYVENCGGVPVHVPTAADWQIDLEAIDRAITPRTRALLLNSPNNPTGVVYPAERLDRLGEVLGAAERRLGTEIYLISDEPYRHILLDDTPCPWVFDHYDRSIVVTSFSKDLAIPGERIGYLALGPRCEPREPIVEGLAFFTRTLGFVNAPALMQAVLPKLLDVRVDIGGYVALRDRLYAALVDIGYEVVRPTGAFYMYPRSPIADDVAFSAVLQRHHVLVVPGAGFGKPGFFRIAYCVPEPVVERSIDGFARAFAEASRMAPTPEPSE